MQNKWKKILWEALPVISSVPTRNYLFKVRNWSTRIRYENCLRLRTMSMALFQYISNFLLIIDFEQTNVCSVNIENINTFEDNIMRSIAVFSVWTKFINKKYLKLYYHNPPGESVRIFAKEFTSDVDSG